MIVCAEIFEKSGARKNSRPFSAPGRVTERATRATIMTKNRGIRNLLVFSIPPETPPMTTVTVKIVGQLTGDTDFSSPEALVAFALGLTLFVITLALNIFALYIVRKYREQYE